MFFPRLYPPTFVGVGAQRAGTTSLYQYLAQHPQVLMSRQKEIGYFDKNYRFPTYFRYYQHFFTNRRGIKASGEITPVYCIFPGAIERIYRYNRRLKLLMLLRNPITRAISQYSIEQHRGHESLPIDEALHPDIEKARALRNHRGLRHHSYLLRGRYHEQIEHIYRYFPKEQVLLLRFEDLTAQPETTMRTVSDFLGIDPLRDVEYQTHNLVKVDYEAPSPELRAHLFEYFAPHNAILTETYGIRTDDWI